MSGYTPGTWRAVDGRILPDNYVLEGAPIATVHARKKTGMQEANARLIAAAPELLKALKVLFDEADAFNVSGVYFNEKCMGHHGLDLARAAIAKATGEQS